MSITARLACASVVTMVLMLVSWSTLLAGSGRHAAVKAAAAATTTSEDDGRSVSLMGWGDPGFVMMRPAEDMRTLVEGVVKKEGPPETRVLCRTCVVRKPIRSKVYTSVVGAS